MKLLTSKFYQPLLSLAEKAKQNLLPDELSIEDIGNLIYPDDDDTELRYQFFSGLEEACQEKQLAFTGDLNSHEIRPELLNDYEELQRQLENCTHDDYGTENSFAWNIVMLSNVFIHRDELKRYFDLVGVEVPKGCLLLNWWTEAEAKRKKRLIPQERNTTELLGLIYRLFKFYGLNEGDERGIYSAKKAWGDLCASKFKDGSIKEIRGIRKTIMIELNTGEKVDEETFSRTYNRRFK